MYLTDVLAARAKGHNACKVKYRRVPSCLFVTLTRYSSKQKNMQFTASSILAALLAQSFVGGADGFFLANGGVLRRTRKLFVATRPEQVQSKTNEPKPSVAPYFKIKDWETALPIMQEFDDLATILELPAFGWSMNKDNMVFRATLNDANELADFYVDSLSSLIDKMLEKAATIDHVEIAGLTEKLRADVGDRPYTEKHYKLEDVRSLLMILACFHEMQ